MVRHLGEAAHGGRIKESCSTADLFDYEFTTEGEQYFTEAPCQLILLRPGRIRAFLERFNGTVEG